MRRQLFALMATAALVVGIATPGDAASPGSGTVGPGSSSLTWSGQSFTAAGTPSPGACPSSADPSNSLCDHFKLTVSADSAYWNTHTGGVSVTISWPGSSNNFDLYVYDSGGSQVGASAQGSGTSESTFVSKPAGTYEVRVVPHSVVNSGYNGSAVFSSTASAGGSSKGGTSGGGTKGSSGGGTSKTGSKGAKGSKGGSKGAKGSKGGSKGGSNGGVSGGGTPTCPGCSINGNSVSQENMYFTYGTDRKDWYWTKQVDQGVPNTGQRLSLPDPQAPDTLPVSVDQGKADKVSAIYFGLLDRGLQAGASIVDFKLKIQEGDAPSPSSGPNQDQPEFNVSGHQIEACRATDYWPDGGGAELYTGLPHFDQSACVTGKASGKAGAMFWTFDLTQLAQPWGQNPNSNFGLVLYPVIPKNPGPQDQSWQVNLKIPARDNPTTPNNEYNDTKNRTVATIAFSTAATSVPSTPPTTPPSSSGGTTGTTGTTSGGTFTGGGTFGGGTPSSTTTTTTTTTGGGTGTSTGPSTPIAVFPGPHLPGIVWALVPIGLLALWAIRQVVLEPVGGPSAGGAIAAIRRRNAAARGMPVEESEDMLTQAKEATRRARSLIRKSLRRR